ncbi:cobyric acid synthase CobQ [Paenibacillus sambharensis]|uniref:Cobyric acid synthase n=1 Tax=Paenibacillus sambharensis TaxID=1803190 RepID=A0A2W1LNY7_9BACL|nr:cobyric acid synthase [Paenibacillus sambharensis]PZD96224.1 cobyric acid synthase CobQ [Paenibacillus sambharensis]
MTVCWLRCRLVWHLILERLVQGLKLNERAHKAVTLMVQGTTSDAGKSLLTTALCRIFTQDGYRTAPFKSQNMSLNSYVTWDGKEIGRAQGMQADACGIAATTDMNPILLKPKGNMTSQVVVHGKPLRDYNARAYREEYLAEAEAIVQDAIGRLRDSYDIVVLEGAGSPVEINLKDREIVNMRMAAWAEAPVLLVADIDRGGVFASIVGTMELLEPHERDRVAGFVINKFRGDVSLLQPGLDFLEQKTGKPVLGVIPYLDALGLEDEDSLSLDSRVARDGLICSGSRAGTGAASGLQEGCGSPDGLLDIVVLRLPRISNFTDIDPLYYESDVRVRYVAEACDFGRPDAVIIPGSKNTVEDWLFLQQSGLAGRLHEYAASGGRVAGICGGYEMMGSRLLDPMKIESDKEETAALNWFPFAVVFAAEKRTVRVQGEARLPGWQDKHPIAGYEIHMGEVRSEGDYDQPFLLAREEAHVRTWSGQNQDEPAYAEGAASGDGRIWGTFLHGVLHNDDFRRAWLNELRAARGLQPIKPLLRFRERREAAFDRLADHVRQHLDMDVIYTIAGLGRNE